MKVNKRILTMIVGVLTIGTMAVGCEKKEDQVTPTVQVTDKEEPVKEEKKEEVNEVIYDKDGIKITYTGIEKEDTYKTTTMTFKIENNNEKNIIVQNDKLAINDVMIQNTFSVDVLSGKSANAELYFMDEDDFEKNGIDEIKKLETELMIMGDDYYVIDQKDLTLDFSNK